MKGPDWIKSLERFVVNDKVGSDFNRRVQHAHMAMKFATSEQDMRQILKRQNVTLAELQQYAAEHPDQQSKNHE